MSTIPVTRTRYAELGIARIAPSDWRYVSRDSAADDFDPYSRCVGPQFKTKGEALAHLDTYASEYDATGAVATGAAMRAALQECRAILQIMVNADAHTGRPLVARHARAFEAITAADRVLGATSAATICEGCGEQGKELARYRITYQKSGLAHSFARYCADCAASVMKDGHEYIRELTQI